MKRFPILLILLLVMSAYADIEVIETVETPSVEPLVGDALVAMNERLQEIANGSAEQAYAALVSNESLMQEIAVVYESEPDNASIPIQEESEAVPNVSAELVVQEPIVEHADIPASQADDKNLSGDVVLDAQEMMATDAPAPVVVPLEEAPVPLSQTPVDVIETIDSPAQAPLVDEPVDDFAESPASRSASPADEEVAAPVEEPIVQEEPAIVEAPVEEPVQIVEENLSDVLVANESPVVVPVADELNTSAIESDAEPNGSSVFSARVEDASGQVLDARIAFIDPKTRGVLAQAELKKGRRTASEISLQKRRVDVELEMREGPVRKIEIRNLTLPEVASSFIRIDDSPESVKSPFGTPWKEVYAIDPTSINFTVANVTVTAKGTELYKCKEWNFTQRTCEGSWVKLQDIVPGEEYSFEITPEDPGYAETGLFSAWLAYYTSTSANLTKFRVWNGTMRNESNATAAIGVGADAEWVVLKSSTTKDDKIMATLDDLGVVKAQIWNASNQAWGNLQTITTSIGTTNDGQRGVDVAYEQLSGRALVVASNGTGTPNYNIWNGTGWQFAQSQNLTVDGCTGIVIWVVLKSKNNSNELLYAEHDANGDHCAQIWNGSAWINNRTLDTAAAGIELTQQFDAAYESVSGDAMVVWEKESTIGDTWSAHYSGGVWNASASTGFDTGGGAGGEWHRLASMPGANRVLFGVIDSEEDFNLREWNGTNWGTTTQIDAAMETVGTTRLFDVAYNGTSGNALAVYVDLGFDVPSFVTCTGSGCFSGTWTAATNTTNTANFCGSAATNLAWVGLSPDPFSSKIYLWGKALTNFGKCFQEWDGTKWNVWQSNLGEGAILVSTEDVMASADAFVDRTGPNVTFISPTPGNNTHQSSTSVVVNVTSVEGETFVGSCTLEFDGVNQSMTIVGSNFSATCNATKTGLSAGNHSYRVFSTNVANVSNVSVNRSVFVDFTGPLVFDVRPVENTTFNISSVIEIAANVTDVSNVSNVSANVTLPNGTIRLVNLTLVTGNKYNASFTIPILSGLYNVSFFANDSLNNVNATVRTNFTAVIPVQLVTNKSDAPDPVVKGRQLNYTITITNIGTGNLTSVTVLEFYPTGVIFNNASPAASSGNATFNLGALTPNQTTTINITVNVSSSVANGTVLNNSYNVTFIDRFGINTTTQNSTLTTVLGFPMILTSKSDSPDPVPKGTTLRYQILVNNTGDDTAFNVTVVDIYPSGVVFNGSQPAPTIANGTFSIGNLSPNQSFTINITVNVSSSVVNGTVLNNSYNVTFANLSGVNFTVVNSTLTTVLGAPVVVSFKSDSPDPVPRGTTLLYQILVNNTGDDTAFNVTLREFYPALGVAFNGSQPSPSSGNDTFSLGNLSPNQSVLVNITVNISAALPNGTVLNNSVNVTFANSSSQNNTVSANASTSVLGTPAILTFKSDTPDPVARGSTLTYQIVINNTGDDYAFNITVIDVYPVNVTFNGSQPAPTIANGTFAIGNLSPNQSFTLNITVNVSPTAPVGSLLNNSYNVTFANSSGANFTVSNSTVTTVAAVVVIGTSKFDSPDPVIKGQTLSYQILVNNTGELTAFNITITESYPSGVVFNGSSPAPTSGNNVFSLGNFSPNQSFLVNITVNVSPSVANGTILNNSYNVTFSNNLSQNTTVTNSSLTTVRGFPMILTSKSDSPDPVPKGTVLQYQIFINNTGDDYAFNVTVVDNYPSQTVFNGSSPAPSIGNGTFSIGNLSPNQSFIINISVNVSQSVANGTVLNNTYNVTFANSSGVNFTVTNSTLTTVLGAPVVVSIKSDSPDPVVKGQQLNYSILINNTGDDVAFNVTLLEFYPTGVTFHNASPSPISGNTTFSIGNLSPNQSFVVNITVNVSAALANRTILTNAVNVSFRNLTGQNFTVGDTEQTTVLGFPVIATFKNDTPDPVRNNETLFYQIVLNNTGDDYAFNITVIDTYPANVTFNASSPVPSIANGTFSIGNLSPNQSFVINITVNMSLNTSNGTILNNSYTVTFANFSGTNLTVANSTLTTVTESDIFPPNISFAAPTESSGSFVNRSFILVNVSANDTNFANVTIFLYNSTGSLVNSTTSNSSPLFVNFSGLADGLYFFNATAHDTKGNSNSTETRNVTIDTTPPRVFDVRPQEGSSFVVNSTIQVSANVTDINTVSNVSANITFPNGTTFRLNLTLATGNKYNASFNVSNRTGQYNVTFFANDTLNNNNQTVTTFFFVAVNDIVVPQVAFVDPTPANDTVTTQTFAPINFTVLEANPDAITLDFNGTQTNFSFPIRNASNSTNLSFAASVLSQTHTIQIFDNASVANLTTTFTISIGTLNVLVNGNNVGTITTSDSSPKRFQNVHSFLVNGTNNITYSPTVAVTALVISSNISYRPLQTSFFANQTSLAEGLYRYNVTANDTSGNMNRTETRIFIVDLTSPVVALVAPTETAGAFLRRSNIVVNVSVTEVNLANVTVSLFNSTGGLVNSTTSTTSPFLVNFTNLADGLYFFNATAFDRANHSNFSVTRNVTLDVTPPLVFDVRPSANTSYNVTATIEVSANVTDVNNVSNVSANITFPNGTVYLANLSLATGNKYNASFTIPLLLGQYNVTFFANDSLGNQNITVTTFFVGVDVVAPNVTNATAVPANINFTQSTNISANVTDLFGVSAVRANITWPNGTNEILFMTFIGSNRYAVIYNTSAQNAVGLYNVTILANDTSNNLNNSVRTNFTVNAVFPIVVTNKSDFPDPVFKGSQLNYTITVSNIGNFSAVNVTVIENYPLNVTFHNSSPSPTSGNNVFALGNFSAGESRTINITVNVSASLSNSTILNNSYNVTFVNITGSNVTVTNSTLTTVLGAPFIVAIKSDSPDPVVRGNQLNYTIFINNTGDDTAFNITVIEFYPPNVTFHSSSPLPTSGNSTFSLGNLSPNQSFLINITVNVSVVLANNTVLNNTVNATFANSSGQQITVTDSELTTVIIDNTAPLVTLLSPAANSTFFLNGTVNITANVTDDAGLDTVRFEVTFPDGLMINFTPDTAGVFKNVTFTNLTQRGNYTVRVFANDTVGNANNSVNVTFQRIPANVIDIVNGQNVSVPFSIAVLSNASNLLNVQVNFTNRHVKYVNISTHNTASVLSVLRLEDEDPLASTPNGSFAEFAIDGSGLNFTNATAFVTAIGTDALYTCKDYNISERDCFGNWTFVQNITAGMNYTLFLTPGDPGFLETSAAVDVALAPINNTAFVVAFIDEAESDVSFRIMNTNGSVIVNTTDVDTGADNTTSRVDVAMVNATHFVITWINGVNDSVSMKIFRINGSNSSGAIVVDPTVGLNTDVSVAELSDRYAVCYANDDDGDADFQAFFNNGTQAVAETNVDGNMAPGATLQNLVDCAGMNGSRWTYFWFDDAVNDAVFSMRSESGSLVVGATLDTDIGETGQVAVTALGNNRSAFVWYDSTDQDVTIAVRDVANTVLLAPTDIDTDAGAVSRVAAGTVRRNETSSEDVFVFAWWDSTSNDIKAAVYNDTGTQITAPFTVESQPNTTFRLLDVAARASTTNTSICPGRFVVAYTNSTGAGVFKGFFTNGSAWDGTCDLENPVVFDVRPVANSTAFIGFSIEIAANVTDDVAVDTVRANVTLPNGSSQLLVLTLIPSTNKYNITFNVSQAGLHNITFIANDTSSKVNNTVRTNFTALVIVANVTTVKIDSPDPVPRGAQLNYSIFVNNTGNGTAFNVTVIETYPAGVTFNNASPVPTVGNNTFAIGNLSANSSFVINITVNVSSALANGTILTNSYNITFANITGNTSTVTNTETTAVRGAQNMTVSKSDSPDPVGAGTQLRYSILINNTGDDYAFNVTLVEGYPNVTFHNSSPAPSSGNNTFGLGNFSPNQSFVVNITVNVSALIPNGTVLNNTVNLSFANFSGQTAAANDSELTTVVAGSAPQVLLVAPANDTNFSSSSVTFRFNATDDFSSALNCTLNINGSANASNVSSQNSTVTNITVSGFSEGHRQWNVSCIDATLQSNVSTNRTFTVDLTPPNFNSLNFTPSDNDSLDPGVPIVFLANVTDNFTSPDVVVLHVLLNGTSLVNITMSLNMTNIYNATFTPNVSGNYTVFLTGNDTVGNFGNSTTLNFTVEFESTWQRSPASFGALSAVQGQTIFIGNLTVNNTGDFNLTFNLTFGLNITSLNETQFNLTPGQVRIIGVNATLPFGTGVFSEVINISASPNATPSQRNTTFTVTTVDDAFLFANLTILPSSVTQGDTNVIIESTVTNVGTRNASNITLNITIPSDWILTGGSFSEFFASLAPNDSVPMVIAVTIPSNAITGLRNVSTTVDGFNDSGVRLSTLNLTLGTTGEVLVNQRVQFGGGGGSGGAGAGGGGGGAGVGGGGGAAAGPMKGAFAHTLIEREVIWTNATIDVPRGTRLIFPLEITNVYNNSLMTEVNLSVIGYMDKYVSWSPAFLSGIPYGVTRMFDVEIEAPAYANTSSIAVNFLITSVLEAPGIEYRNGIPFSSKFKKVISEYKTLTVNILELSPLEAKRLAAEVERLYAQAVAKGYPVKRAGALRELLLEALAERNYDDVVYLARKLTLLLERELEAGSALEKVRVRIDDANAQGISVLETERILHEAVTAFEREDFNAALRLADSALEVKAIELSRVWTIIGFLEVYWWLMLLVVAALSPLAYRGVNKWRSMRITQMISFSINQQLAIRKLMKEHQDAYFIKNQMGSREYYMGLQDYQSRVEHLSRDIARMRIARARLLTGRKALEIGTTERERITSVMKRVQDAYFVSKTISRSKYMAQMEELDRMIAEIDAHISEVRKRVIK